MRIFKLVSGNLKDNPFLSAFAVGILCNAPPGSRDFPFGYAVKMSQEQFRPWGNQQHSTGVSAV
jgi:hypothetical protein